jgi:hypothetical protein
MICEQMSLAPAPPSEMQFEPQAVKFKALSKSAARIARLLRGSRVQASKEMTSCIDDLWERYTRLSLPQREDLSTAYASPRRLTKSEFVPTNWRKAFCA